VFDNEVDPAWRFDLFELIHATPSLDWLLLTKRIGNVGNMLPVPFDFARLYPNVWIGATIVNQAEADRDIPKLLATPAAVRFLSMEPLLGPVDLTVVRAFGLHGFGDFEHGVDWVIVGGESGPGARPMHPDWARSLRDQCRQAAVPMLFKQWGEWQPLIQMTISERRASAGKPLSDDSYVRIDGTTHTTLQDDHEPYEVTDALVRRVGKKAAGRRLDGVEHNGFPESRT
jgi:protein gp37